MEVLNSDLDSQDLEATALETVISSMLGELNARGSELKLVLKQIKAADEELKSLKSQKLENDALQARHPPTNC